MIQREISDVGICMLIFDRPESGANIFDAPTLADLSEHVAFIENEPTLKGLIITSAKKSIFIAGADLKTLMRQAARGEMRTFIAEGQRVFNRIAALKIPTCAAIHGACAGGGYEITLVCDYRVASNDPSTKIGLPETTLGLIPAWGGATRLPRLIGVEKSADVILKGKLYPAAEAKELGLVDEVVAREQLLEAARAKLQTGKKRPPPSPLPEGEADGKAAGEDQTRSVLQTVGNPAPARAREIISKTLHVSIDDSLQMELDAIVDLGETESTRNLVRNFFLADKYRKGSSKPVAEKVAHAAVIGAGVMGSGIAQWLSSRGVSVILRDVNAEAIDRGLANIDKTYGDAVKRGLMSEDESERGPRSHCRFHCTRGNAQRANCDRSGVRKARNQKANLCRSLRENWAGCDSRDEYLGAADSRTGRHHEIAGTRYRHAFFQSRQPDEAGGSSRRQTNRAGNNRSRARIYATDRKAACACAGQSRLSRQSGAFPLFDRSCATLRKRRERERN